MKNPFDSEWLKSSRCPGIVRRFFQEFLCVHEWDYEDKGRIARCEKCGVMMDLFTEIGNREYWRPYWPGGK